jgi:hypothetical protein
VLCILDLEKAYDHVCWDFSLIHVKEMWPWGEMAKLDYALHIHCLVLYFFIGKLYMHPVGLEPMASPSTLPQRKHHFEVKLIGHCLIFYSD